MIKVTCIVEFRLGEKLAPPRRAILHKPEHHVAIYIIIPAKKGELLNSHAVKELVKKLKLEVANKWEDCWQDDDSPQYELSFGVCKATAFKGIG